MRKDIVRVIIDRRTDYEPSGITSCIGDVTVSFWNNLNSSDACYVSELDYQTQGFGLTRAEVNSIREKALEVIERGAIYRIIDLRAKRERDYF